MTDAPRPIRTRPRWPWIVGALAVLVVLVVVAALTAPRGGDDRAVPATNTLAPTATSTGSSTAQPTGCLGGPKRDAAMVRAAQKAAPHTSSGAVEFTTALVRWMFRAPTATPAEADEVSKFAVASNASDSFKDLAAAIAKNPNPSAGVVEDGKAFYLSTVPGVWNLESYEGDTATVSVGSAYVIDGAMSPTLRAASTFTVQWENGAWRLVSGEYKRTTQELFSIGTQFTGGC
jgi:hypothetical protein